MVDLVYIFRQRTSLQLLYELWLTAVRLQYEPRFAVNILNLCNLQYRDGARITFHTSIS